MATLKNITTTVATSDKLPSGTTAQRPSSPQTGMMRFNTTFNEVEYYNGTQWINPNTGTIPGLGQSSATAANSAQEILKAYPNSPDGVYWINLPVDGPRETFCLMDRRFDGGGWMMAMKATTGNTFPYSSNYWTTDNTLNETTQLNRNNADAKFHVMNRFAAKDILAVWPDIGQGGSIRGVGNWTWLENNFYGQRISLISFFSTVDRWFISDAKKFSGWQAGVFSSQVDVRYYGFNYVSNRNVRWGFGWNENGGGLWPEGQNTSDDVGGGIGLSNGWSAGDNINCCQDTTGINRQARVEVYVR